MTLKYVTTLAFATLLSAASMVAMAQTTGTSDPMNKTPSTTGMGADPTNDEGTVPSNRTLNPPSKANQNSSHVPGTKGSNNNGADQSTSTGVGKGSGADGDTTNEIK
ncbi:hypothetical protein QN386_13260 [Pseudomonas sp. CCI3.2]|uniref:hypothetical protein n=1 Tax=unclassified Pseudomonas TaxID=196821 RepID=UPI002AC8EBF6|nr:MULTISPECIES: hypothetical protein [unclassified Pseudomonas]MEB0079660.1 hypothetical protein [Pseudomonas sp. MH10out]MEB0093399.1 hypothetical protein [Pseudomonas sp. CCI4.2]MEB0102284.1 hypothetical protein [Pseudomonas sp. CCI3.2]MEB0129416.1 hypothetical protein [Pseudomonas sp. CCI2.4]MEB0160581.1 hypothetical protein [Pseudomonas sp. AH2 (2023)]